MTTLKDLLKDFAEEVKQITVESENIDLEIEDLVEDYIEEIINRIIK